MRTSEILENCFLGQKPRAITFKGVNFQEILWSITIRL